MPLITKTESFSLNGMLFNTEIEAVEQGLLNLGAKIVKEFSSCGGQGLVANREELLELLTAHKRLQHTPTREEMQDRTSNRDPTTGLLPGQVIGAL
jgi:hypothetical protein